MPRCRANAGKRLFLSSRNLLDDCHRVERAWVADKGNVVAHDLNEEVAIVAAMHVAGGMRLELRLATALRSNEAEGDQLTLGNGEPTTRIPIAKAVLHQPLGDVRVIGSAAILVSVHLFAKAGNLCLLATLVA